VPETAPALIAFVGDEAWREPIVRALKGVADPEAALSIVDMGLVLSVEVNTDWVHVRLIMTSAACPVAEVIVDEVEQALDRVLPPALQIRVEVCHDVEWTPARMSAEARRFMQW
jgi:metal-sulfur cluster biosynthetic enzyme